MINYASKYEKRLAQEFTQKSVVDGAVGNDYEFTGVKNIKVYTAVSQELNDYKRTGTNRYGEPTEVQDTIQDMEVKKDRSFSLTVDKGNNSEQMDAKAPGKILKIEMDEQVIPEMDKYALTTYIDYAGLTDAVAETPTEETIVKLLSNGLVAMGNAKVPNQNRTIYLTWDMFGLLRLSKQFIGVDGLAKGILNDGVLGTFMGAKVIAVPDDYLMKNGKKAHVLIFYKNSVLQPKKIQDYFVKENPAGINGALIEGRFIYDAFVIGAKAKGVYALTEANARQIKPTIAISGGNATITSAGASKIRVTTDGTDPRFSDTAVETTTGGAVPAATGVTVKAVALSDTAFVSEVETKTA